MWRHRCPPVISGFAVAASIARLLGDACLAQALENGLALGQICAVNRVQTLGAEEEVVERIKLAPIESARRPPACFPSLATPIPGFDALVDLGAPPGPIWYWWAVCHNARRARQISVMKFVKANGLVLHFSDQGRPDGPALAFVNSLGTDFRIWDEVAAILAPDFRIIFHDKRSHGLSEAGPDTNDIADYARDLAALLDGAGVRRATIVGLSIGGLIAQEFYRQSPERVAALVLCDTAAKIGTDEVWDQRIAEVERNGIEALADGVMQRWFTAQFRAARTAELAGMRAMLTRTPRQGYVAGLRSLEARRSSPVCQ